MASEGGGGGIRIGSVFWELSTKVSSDFKPQLAAATVQLNQVNQVAKQVGVNVGAAQTVIVNMATRSAAATKQAADAAQTFGQRYGRAALAVASASTAISAQGNLSASSLKNLLSGGAAVAGFFGPQGALVAAIGLSLANMLGLFSKTREEMERTVEEGRKAVLTLRGQIEGERRAGDQPALLKRVDEGERNLLLDRKELLAVTAQIRNLENEINTGRKRDTTKLTEEELAAAREVLALASARREELQKTIPLRLQEIQLATQAALNIESQRAGARGLQGVTTSSGKSPAQLAREAKNYADRLREANRALDEFRQKQEAVGQIAEAQQQAVLRLAEAMGDTVKVIDAEISSTIERFRELGATDAEIATIIAPLEAAKQAALGLRLELGKVPEALQPKRGKTPAQIAQETEAALEKARAAAVSTADAIATVGNSILSVAGALGVIDEQVQSVGRGLLNIGAGVIKGGPLGIVQVIGGLGDVLSGLFGKKDDPEARRRAEILEQNSQRLAELRDTLGELITVSVSGRDIANLRAETFARSSFGIGTLAPGEQVQHRAATATEVIASLRAAGTSLRELQQIASDFGITLSESPTIDELKALQEAINTFSLTQFTETFAGQLQLLQQEFDLFDIEDPVERLRKFIELLNDDKVGAPAVFNELLNLDVGTAEGREAARAFVQGIFEQFKAGTLDVGDFGGLTPAQLLDALTTVIRDLGAAAGPTEEGLTALAEALKAAEDAAIQDLRLRELRATSHDDEADALEQQIANERELAEARKAGLSESTLAQIEYVQGLEAAARAARDAAAAAEEAAAAIEAAAEAERRRADFAEDIDIEFLRATGQEKEAERAQIFARHHQRVAAAARAGFNQTTMDQINAILEAELSDFEKKWSQTVGEVGDAVRDLGAAPGGGGTTSGSLQQMTLYQGDRLITIGESQLLQLTEINRHVQGLIRSTFAPLPVIAPPLPAAGFASSNVAGGTTVIVNIARIVVTPPAGTHDPVEFARAINRALADELIQERFFAGSSLVI